MGNTVRANESREPKDEGRGARVGGWNQKTIALLRCSGWKNDMTTKTVSSPGN